MIYYNSFADTLRGFNLNPDQIFTFDDLKQEWKDHCQFGFILSQAVLRIKLGNVVEIPKMDLYNGSELAVAQEIMELWQTDEKRLREICLDLVQHLYDNDYL